MHAARGSNWKLVVLIIVLILVVAALGFLCVRFFLGDGSLDIFPTRTQAVVDSSLPTKVAAQDAKGKDISNKVSVTAGTLRPDTVAPDADVTLMDISWAGRGEANYPLIVTVSDNSFPNDDGLSVYHFNGTEWELLGTYLIAGHAVSFQADSLSPFAFQVISSKPEPTPTPAPTPTPEPTATPEPTPEPVDYGAYDRVQVGEFSQVTFMRDNGAYIFALVDDPTENAANAAEPGTQFGPFKAQILINYNGTDLRTVPGEVSKDADGVYTITTPVVEGMLWTAVDSDIVNEAERYSLANNEKFLNLDEDNVHFVLNDDDVRTRWLFGPVQPENGDEFSTVSYYTTEGTHYIKTMDMTDSVSGEGTAAGKTLDMTATTNSAEAKKVVIFQLRTAQLQVTATPAPTSTANTTSDGTLILTNTPSAVTGLDATPRPTATPDNSTILTPVTPNVTNPPPVNNDPTPTPYTAPTVIPVQTNPPVAETDPPVFVSGSDAEQPSVPSSGTDA